MSGHVFPVPNGTECNEKAEKEEKKMCDRINMHQVLEKMEKQRAGSNFFRYQTEKRMKEVSAETFFRDVRICAHNLEYSNLCGRHIILS